MKRVVLAFLIFIAAAGLASAEQQNPPVSFGMQLGIDYNLSGDSLTLWNFRYGLGIDFLVRLAGPLYLGVELGADFGFHKVNLTDPGFDRVDVQFPLHLTALLFLGSFTIQAYGGVNYVGGANLTGGVVYASDFSFTPLPDAGLKIGWGTINSLFVKGGCLFGDEETFYFGLGARIGLF